MYKKILVPLDGSMLAEIAMSSHGRSGFGRLVYGSVAEKVLQGATCPVLLIRAKPEE